MRRWFLLALIGAVVLLAFILHTTERFTDPDQPVRRPCICTPATCSDTPGGCRRTTSTAWSSKISALAPVGYVEADYLTVLQAFYDQIYDPSGTRPTEAQVNTFLASSAGTVSGVDRPSVKRILMAGFHIESSQTASQNEDASRNFAVDTAILEATAPEAAGVAPPVDEVRTRAEGEYVGANPSPSTKFSEGNYAPPPQSQPKNPGQWEDGSIRWKGPRPASVCPCAENIM
jgi:hypothetical protein